MILYRKLKRFEIQRIREIQRNENVTQNYRISDGKLELFEYRCVIKGFSEEKIIKLTDDLNALYDRGGNVFGAFIDNKLVGIASMDCIWRGKSKKTLQLALLHISREFRNRGIGKKLVMLVKNEALEQGAEKLYISAAPIKNTVDFYMAIGCRITPDIEKDLFAIEPDDIHLELTI